MKSKLKIMFCVVLTIALSALSTVTALASTPTSVSSVISGIDLAPAMGELVTGAGALITQIIPIGVGLILLFSIPRIIRRLISTFI